MTGNKSQEIKVRVTNAMKTALVSLAEQRGEGESVIIREAINQYLAATDAKDSASHRTMPVSKRKAA